METEIVKLSDHVDVETLFKAEPPFMQVKDGFGYMGVVLRDKIEDTVQCHICGIWKSMLVQHVRLTHKMTLDVYRQKFGLPLNFPLCGLATSSKLRVVAL